MIQFKKKEIQILWSRIGAHVQMFNLILNPDVVWMVMVAMVTIVGLIVQ